MVGNFFNMVSVINKIPIICAIPNAICHYWGKGNPRCLYHSYYIIVKILAGTIRQLKNKIYSDTEYQHSERNEHRNRKYFCLMKS